MTTGTGSMFDFFKPFGEMGTSMLNWIRSPRTRDKLYKIGNKVKVAQKLESETGIDNAIRTADFFAERLKLKLKQEGKNLDEKERKFWEKEMKFWEDVSRLLKEKDAQIMPEEPPPTKQSSSQAKPQPKVNQKNRPQKPKYTSAQRIKGIQRSRARYYAKQAKKQASARSEPSATPRSRFSASAGPGASASQPRHGASASQPRHGASASQSRHGASASQSRPTPRTYQRVHQRRNLDELYTKLGIDSNASEKEIKKGYHKMAYKHHPDRGGNEAKFKNIKQAYEILIDEEKKKYCRDYGLDNFTKHYPALPPRYSAFGSKKKKKGSKKGLKKNKKKKGSKKKGKK